MPKFSFAVPNPKSVVDAKQSLRGYMEKMKEMYAGQVAEMTDDWSKWDSDDAYGFSFSSMGFKINGTMKVEEKEVRVDGDIPFAAMMFKGKIEKSFRDIIDRALS